MKLFYKICFIIGGCMVCLGLAIGVVGMVFGGHTQLLNMAENGELSFHGTQFFDRFDIDFDNSDIRWSMGSDEMVFDGNKVEDLDIRIGGGILEVVQYDGKQYKIEAKDIEYFKCGLEGNTLHIKSREEPSNKKRIKLYIPKDAVLDEADIQVGAGIVEFHDAKMENLSVEVGAGQFNAGNIEAQNGTFLMGAGTMRLEDITMEDSDFQVGMGTVYFEGALNGNVDAECSMGTIEMNLAGDQEDYNYVLKCSAGNINVDGHSISGLGSEREIDNGSDNEFNIDCSMGSVNVGFQH